jgi:hypothetical protein
MLPPPSDFTPTGPLQLGKLLLSMFIHHGLRSMLSAVAVGGNELF